MDRRVQGRGRHRGDGFPGGARLRARHVRWRGRHRCQAGNARPVSRPIAQQDRPFLDRRRPRHAAGGLCLSFEQCDRESHGTPARRADARGHRSGTPEGWSAPRESRLHAHRPHHRACAVDFALFSERQRSRSFAAPAFSALRHSASRFGRNLADRLVCVAARVDQPGAATGVLHPARFTRPRCAGTRTAAPMDHLGQGRLAHFRRQPRGASKA